MARKPSITRKSRTIRTLNAETARSTEEVPFGINLIAKHLSDITTKLGMIVDALALGPTPSAPVADPDASRRMEEIKSYGDRIARLEGFPTGIESRIAALEAKTCSCPEMAPTLDGNGQPVIAPKRHRRTKAEMEAARAAEAAAAATPAETTAGAQAAREAVQLKADRATCTHPQTAVVPTNPKLSRCLLCGAVIETPAAAVPPPVAATPPTPPPPPPAAQPTLDDVRGAAIGWIGKHGKEKFTALLAEKFGAAQISAVPQAQWASLIASLSNGA